jgi:prophage antirepressor-like protein
MSNLALVKSEMFGDIQCDFYQNKENELFLTRKQIGESLEYSNPNNAIKDIHKRHKDRLDKFSRIAQIALPSGGTQSTTVYSTKGVYEVCRWSQQPKANDFYDWVYEMLEALRTGELYKATFQPHIQALQEAQNTLLKLTEGIKSENAELRERLEITEYRTENITIDSYCQKLIQQAVKEKIKSLPGNRFDNRKRIQALYKCIRFKFGVPSFRDIRIVDYAAVMGYIQKWKSGN